MNITNRKELDQKTTEIMNEYGAFFAFSTEQFKDSSKEGIEYISLGGGLIAQKDNYEKLENELLSAIKAFEQYELNTIGKEKLIWRELANHEAQISYDIESTVYALEGYGITRDDIEAIFPAYMNYCREHDLF